MPSDAEDLWASWEKLGEGRIWTYEHEDARMVVRVDYDNWWPGLRVSIGQQGAATRAIGEFAPDGRLLRLTFELADESVGAAEITAAAQRQPVLGALRAWHLVGREVARKILAGEPPESIAIDGRNATEALRILRHAGGWTPEPQRWRGARREARIRSIASAYREMVAAGEKHPRALLAGTYGLTEDHVGKLLGAARRERNGQPAVLGPALPGRAGEAHAPDAAPSAD